MTRVALHHGHTPGRTPAVPLDGIAAQPWMEHAACRGENPETFYPPTGPYTKAQTICDHCPVRAECLDWAMTCETGRTAWARFGMWGGLTPDQRAELAVERRAS